MTFHGGLDERRMFVKHKAQNKHRLTSSIYLFMKCLVNFRDNKSQQMKSLANVWNRL